MVRDLMIDIKEHDLLFEDKSNAAEPVYDTVWGNLFDADKQVDFLICNVIIPEAYWTAAKYDDDGELTCRFTSAYKPEVKIFNLRLVGLKNGKYSLFSNIRGKYGVSTRSFAFSKNMAAPIYACQLPYIDIDGEFVAKFVKNANNEALDKAYIYSSKQSDITVDYSDDQAAQLLTLCAPGKSYRYPTTGVGITSYLNSVVAHTDLEDVLKAQFDADKKPIQSADFDSSTGGLDAIFSPENEEKDTGLEDVDNLNVNFFNIFTDDYVRKNVVLNELVDTDFTKLLSGYANILSLLLFVDDTTTITRIANSVETGRFDGEGNVVASDEYYIVTATLEANTIIMFDDEKEDNVSDAPIFIINDNDESRLYTALVEQPYWLTENCHKCMILQRRATVKYMIRQDQFKTGSKGLFTVSQTSANIKNMCAMVQDEATGRLLGIVSNQTNISDMSLEEITQYIYASKINE